MRAFHLSVVVHLLMLVPVCFSEDEHQPSITDNFGHAVMEGLIDEKRPVTAHLWFETDNEGDLRLSGAIQEVSPRRLIRFYGSASEESDSLQLVLTSGTHGGEGETIGHWEAEWLKGVGAEPAALTGNLKMLNGGQKSSIRLRQILPPGGVQLDYHCFEEGYERKRGDNTFHRQLRIAFPQIRSDDLAHGTINATIRHWALHGLTNPSVKSDASSSAPSLSQVEAAVRAELPDRSQPERMAVEREEIIEVSHVFEVLHNQHGLLCLRMTKTQYLGGAHEMFSSGHLIFDLGTGRTLRMEDLLIKGWQDTLAEMAANDLRAQFGLPAGSPLSSPGPLDAEFKLNDNLFISHEGLGVYFAPYELGPFALGALTPIIPLHKVSHLIQQGSALWRIHKGEAN